MILASSISNEIFSGLFDDMDWFDITFFLGFISVAFFGFVLGPCFLWASICKRYHRPKYKSKRRLREEEEAMKEEIIQKARDRREAMKAKEWMTGKPSGPSRKIVFWAIMGIIILAIAVFASGLPWMIPALLGY